MSKHTVNHPKLFMRVNGKTQHLEMGSVLEDLSAAQLERLGNKVKPFKAAAVVDMKEDDKKGKK